MAVFLFSKLLHGRWTRQKLCLFREVFCLFGWFFSWFLFFLFPQCDNFLCCVCVSVGFLLVSLFSSLNLIFSSLSFVTESYRILFYLFTHEMHGVIFFIVKVVSKLIAETVLFPWVISCIIIYQRIISGFFFFFSQTKSLWIIKYLGFLTRFKIAVQFDSIHYLYSYRAFICTLYVRKVNSSPFLLFMCDKITAWCLFVFFYGSLFHDGVFFPNSVQRRI